MNTDLTFEATTFNDLESGDIFTGVNQEGVFLAMKVAVKHEEDDKPNYDILLFNNKSLMILPSHVLRTNVVAKMNKLTFVANPHQLSDMLLDIKNNPQVRRVLGAAFVVGSGIFLGADSVEGSAYYVNVETGEARPSLLKAANINDWSKAIVIKSWQIVEMMGEGTTGESTTWFSYSIPPEAKAA